MDGKDPKWRQAAHSTLETLARHNQYIVSDTLIAALEDAGYGLNNYSALGGVFTRAAKERLIVKTGNYQQSNRTKSHSAKTVWRSLVYKESATLEETIENIFTLKVSSSGADITVFIGDSQMSVSYDEFIKLRHRIAMLVLKRGLQARIDENTYHWHHQKSIERETREGGVSGYFLERKDVLNSMLAKADSEQTENVGA